MTKIFFLLSFLLSVGAVAQNVGIGTATPSGKLEIRNPLRSILKISTANYDDTTELLLSNRNGINQGTDFSIKSLREEGLFFSSLSDIAGNNAANSLVILPNGNIGISDPSSSAKLTVRGNEITADGQAAAIKLQNIASTNAWYLRAGATGTNTPANGFSIADNSGYHFTMAQGGNIGLGINPSTARLHVNGMIKLEGLNVFEFGAGVAGKEINAGKIGYNGFGQNALTFVGAGTNATNRAVYFFAEGGTTFSGPVNIIGPLRINGNPGTNGQVLSSNGTSSPAWVNAPYSNTTRFALRFTHNITTGHSLAPLTLIYNLNPADFTLGANSFTINKTGLYHFDIILNSTLSIPGSYAALNFYFSPGDIDFLSDEPVIPNGVTSIGRSNHRFTLERHFTAGTVLSFGSYTALGTSGTNTGWMYGHLISE